MRAIVVQRTGGPETLRESRLADPVPACTEALVEIAAAGVNFIDIYHRSGAYPVSLPFVPGVEGVGMVVDVGADVREVSVGDRVGWVNIPGSYAERAAVPADRLVPIPDRIGDADAAAILLQGMTAHYLTEDTCPVGPGDSVLVHAAAGGMGMLLTQLFARRGARVIAIVSTAAKAELARATGAAEVIVGYAAGLPEQVRELTGGGVAAVLDGVGRPTFDASLAALRPRGVLALYGQAGGAVAPVDPQRLNEAGSVFLTRPNLAHHIAERAELLRRAAAVFDWVETGRLQVRSATSYPLAEASTAHSELEGRRSAGKLVLLT